MIFYLVPSALNRKKMNQLQKFLDLYEWKGFVYLLFSPIITLLTTPVRLCQTLWNCRDLADGRNWGNYPHFSPHFAVSNLFYWTAALNLSRFGRHGRSPYLGLGNCSLSHYFHYSFLSLYAYWKTGIVTLLVGMFGWWIGHFLWLDQAGISSWWAISILTLALFSTTFYANVFALQNYNVLGWMFVPVFLFAWANGFWILATLMILCVSFASFTVFFLTCWLALFYSFQIWSPFPMLTVIPSLIKTLTHFYPYLENGEIKSSISNVAKAIGITKKNVKYTRKKITIFDISWLYLFAIYLQFIICFYVFNNNIPLLLIASVMIWIINSRFLRFCDDQPIQMLILSNTIAAIIQSNVQNIWLLMSFWIIASPVPLLASFFPSQKCLVIVPIFKPFNIMPIINEMESFLSVVKQDERVVMAFDEPQGEYERVFDGYRVLLEVPLYVSAKRRIHFMPDWWGVFELNYQGAPDFWGREIDDVQKKMKAWEACYVVVYQPTGTKLKDKWIQAGFEKLSRFSWKKFEKQFGEVRPYSGSTPDWWLLRKEKCMISSVKKS